MRPESKAEQLEVLGVEWSGAAWWVRHRPKGMAVQLRRGGCSDECESVLVGRDGTR